MRILLDENLDWRLSRELVGHPVDSVPLIGWSGTKNGALLRRAVEAGEFLSAASISPFPFRHLSSILSHRPQGLSIAALALSLDSLAREG